jgi:hypothetical protein
MDNTFSPEIGKLAEALSKAQAVIEGAKEDSTNPFFKSKYADLSSVWKACKKPLTDNGLAVTQTVENGGEKIYLVTTLLHLSGQWMRSYMPVMITKQDAQGFGSAMTYSRRYALAAMVGVCPQDDDAESAMQNVRKPAIAYITKGQVEEIDNLLMGRPELARKLFDWANIEDISDLPASKYPATMKAIETHLAKEGVA